MKYKDFDAEILTDERDFRNFKITLSLGIIGACWALKPTTGSLDVSLVRSIIAGVLFLGIECLRIYLSVQHCRACRNKFIKEKDEEKKTMEQIWDLDIDAGAYSTVHGTISTVLYSINYAFLASSFILFVIGALNSILP